MTTLTLKDMYAIRTVLLDVVLRTDLPTDIKPIKKALLKINSTIDNYCILQHYNEFVLVPMLAENEQE